MKLTTNKIALSFVIVNLLLIAVAYFGLLNPAGFMNYIMGSFKYIEGTPEEYWKIYLDTRFGSIYLTLCILSFFVIIFYRGKGDIVRNITGALKIQLLIGLLCGIVIYELNPSLTRNSIGNTINFNIYFLLIPIISAILINIKNTKNIKLIVISAVSCISITITLCLQINLMFVSVLDQVMVASLQFTEDGTPLYKNKVNLLTVETMPDGFANLERTSKNYTDFLALFHYPSINKTTNEEIFEIVDKFSKNYVVKNESYLKEKLGDDVNSTRLHIYGKLAKLSDIDVKLLNIYRTQGIDAAMKELETTKNSLIKMFIEKKREFDKNYIKPEQKKANDKEIINLTTKSI